MSKLLLNNESGKILKVYDVDKHQDGLVSCDAIYPFGLMQEERIHPSDLKKNKWMAINEREYILLATIYIRLGHRIAMILREPNVHKSVTEQLQKENENIPFKDSTQ